MGFIQTRFGFLSGFVALLILSCTLFMNVSAQQPAETVSLGISPQILDLTANPGETLTNSFRLTNGSSEALDIEAVPKNFLPQGETGAIDLTIDETSFSLAQWITPAPGRIVVEPGKTQEFTIGIQVPENAEPGSHFGSVVFRTIPPEQEDSIALVSQEIAPVILVRIAGDTTEAAEIIDFKTEKSLYSNEDAVVFESRIENTGSVHFKPTAKITIEDTFGSQVAELDVDQRNVLPGSIRLLSTEWPTDDGFKMGRYKATLSLVYGDTDEIRVATTSFTIFPYQTVIPVAIVIIIVMVALFKFRDRIKRAVLVLSGKDQPQVDNKEEQKTEE